MATNSPYQDAYARDNNAPIADTGMTGVGENPSCLTSEPPQRGRFPRGCPSSNLSANSAIQNDDQEGRQKQFLLTLEDVTPPPFAPGPASEIDIHDRSDLENKLKTALDSSQGLQNELEKEHSLRKKLENELSQTNDELDDIRKRWRQVASELNKIRMQGQGFYQVTDRYLLDFVSKLRYNIRNVAIQYFEGELKQRVTPKHTDYHRYFDFILPTSSGKSILGTILHSPRSCPTLIQAFLWQVLVVEVFNQFLWAGNVRESVWTLRDALKPTRENPDQPGSDSRLDPQAARKLQIWSATTAELLLDAVDPKEVDESLERRKHRILEKICETIDPFARSMNEGYKHELLGIIEDAIALDRELCKQVSQVTWVFENGRVESGNEATDKREIQLVVAPGLKKKGKSTGEDFDVENMLLPPRGLCLVVYT